MFVVVPSGDVESDAVHIGQNLFAIADGVDHIAGSGAAALSSVLRLVETPAARRSLTNVLRAANWSLWYHTRPTQRAYGVATVTVAIWTGYRFLIGHVGDGRAYLATPHGPRLLTVEHAQQRSPGPGQPWADDAVRLGQSQANDRADVITVPARPGDRLLLCTDGLWRHLDDGEIETLTEGSVEEVTKRLQTHAQRHAVENASAVLVGLEAHRALRPRPGAGG